jgi:arsenite-transporting ATPase
LFFTGKGGVGKTSLSTAVALHLADSGKKVLLVSTDSASNLDDMQGITLSNQPTPVPGAPGLSVLNIDPDAAAQAYRQRVVDQMASDATAKEVSTVREQLSGACATEIASFDEFSSLLADNNQPYGILAADTHDPLLQARLAGEALQMDKVENGLTKKTYVLPPLAQPPIGVEALGRLVAPTASP